MKKCRMIWKAIRCVLLFIVFFLMLIVIRSASWFLLNFHEVELATALYQISSPLQGTEEGVLTSYLYDCLYPSLSFSVIVVVFYTIWDMITEKLILKTDIRIGSKVLCVSLGKGRFAKASRILALWLGVVLLGVGVWDKALAVGLPEYLYSVMNASTLYENEYVDPDSVFVTFPEQKRNLLVLYLESMESTFASTEEGGGKPYNYIPELTELAKDNLQFSDDEDMGANIRRRPDGR